MCAQNIIIMYEFDSYFVGCTRKIIVRLSTALKRVERTTCLIIPAGDVIDDDSGLVTVNNRDVPIV